MGLNDTPKGERVHIAVFGRRNAGKSSLINAITGQDLSIVSDVKGTTTDPVFKAMELLPLGPVMMIDTPGLDDIGELGKLRMDKTRKVLNQTDVALIVMDGKELEENQDMEKEKEILEQIEQDKIPYFIVINKIDRVDGEKASSLVKSEFPKSKLICTSAKTNQGIHELKEAIGALNQTDADRYIISDLVEPGDFVVLVIPIDSAAPKGRLILPQQQTIRELLEVGATSIVVRETELESTLLELGKKPKLVVTDSQAFHKVAEVTPKDILLTSFSILFSRYKGNLRQQILGATALDSLEDNDIVLISEGCTHHRQCDDIGTVKIPRWIENYSGKKIQFETTSGLEFPDDLSKYKMVVHCGGCMLNRQEMQHRLRVAKLQNIPMVNYGTLIAYVNGILKRTLEPFTDYNQMI